MPSCDIDCTKAPYYPDRVTIESDGSAAGERRDFTNSFQSDWPCLITAIGGDETWRGRTLEGKVDFVVEGPFVTGVNSRMRLNVTSGRGMFDDRLLNIKSSRPTQRRGQQRMLEIYCTEKDG